MDCKLQPGTNLRCNPDAHGMSSFTTPPRRHRQSVSPGKLLCSCKAARCAVEWCMNCSKCCLQHNSRLKAGKDKRSRGRPKKGTAADQGFARLARKTTSYSGLLTPLTPSKSSTTPSYLQILEFFGFDSTESTFLGKHLPPRNVRRTSEFWSLNGDDDVSRINQRLAVMRFYRAVLFRIAESLCVEEDATMASLDSFSMWLRPDPTSSDHQEVARVCMRAIASAKKGTAERRIVRATLCSAFKLRDLDALTADLPGAAIGSTTYAKSRHDFDAILQTGELPRKTWSRQKFDTTTVNAAVQFILAYDNVAYLSWGTKKIKLDGMIHDAPSILLKKPVSVVFEQYCEQYKDRAVSQASFYRLCATLTNGKLEPRTCVDYVTGFLVYDTFEVLAAIVQRAVPDQVTSLKAKLDIIQAWLKYGHARRLSDGDTANCPRHNVEYGLSAPKASGDDEQAVRCSECISLYKFFHHLHQLIASSTIDASAVNVTHDILHKLELFMGHRLRVSNQQREIAKMIDEAKKECLANGSTDLAVVLVDFKMKAEPIYFREKTADHYGKRGMSWHGVQIRSWELGQQSAHVGDVMETVLYYDQLSSSDNKQDKGAVISLLEATMMALRRHLPHVRRIVVQSDNASCYQNACVMLMLPIIGYVYGIAVERYEHTETQDGKSPLDGHFGQSQRKVRRFVAQGNNCVTPTQYVVALVADGGLPNCVAELVEYNRSRVAELLQQVAPLEAALAKIVGRVNDVFYRFPDHAYQNTEPFAIACLPDFSMKAYLYSAIGSGIDIVVSPSRSTCIRHGSDTAVGEDGGTDIALAGLTQEEPETAAFGSDSDIIQCVDCLDPDDIENACVEQDTSEELVNATGVVTGICVNVTARLIRRARQWRYAATALSTLREKTPRGDALSETPDVQVEDKNMVAWAKRRLLSLCGSGEIGVVDAGELPAQMTAMASELPYNSDDVALPVLKRGWARRPPNGKMYGAKYIRLYENDVRAMFERGANDKAEKLGAGRMVEELRRCYPHRFDLPSEGEIRAEVSRLFTVSRKRARAQHNDSAAPSGKRRSMNPEYAEYLESIVTENPLLMPATAVPLLRSVFPDSQEDISDAQIRSKVSSLKRKLHLKVTSTATEL